MAVAAKRETCPHCDADLLGDPLPEKYRHHNIPGTEFYNEKNPTCEESLARDAERMARFGGAREPRCFCLPYGDITHFSRTILCEIQGVYDGGLFYMCPDCGGAWHRWVDPAMKRKAQPYIDERNREANVA